LSKKKSLTAAERDERSREKSTHALNDKIKLISSNERMRWQRNGVSAKYMEHDFTIDGVVNYVYRLTIEEDQSIKAQRFDKERTFNTPRSLSADFAKVLYMKVWPNVGI
jgi:hypothetical protein